MKQKFIGLMSGTSKDGLDGCLVDFSDGFNFICGETMSFNDKYKSSDDIQFLDQEITTVSIELVNCIIEKSGLDKNDISGVAFSGQTISHNDKLSVQAGNPDKIARALGMTVFSDFRNEDIKRGGRGAPLIPPFHAYLFGDKKQDSLIINIGGIANGTYLKKGEIQIGTDIGPGNCLMDLVMLKNELGQFDNEGILASQGHCIDELLEKSTNLLSNLSYPRADDITQYTKIYDQFNCNQYKAEDLLATFAELTSLKIREFHDYCNRPSNLILHGGGIKNNFLMNKIKQSIGEFKTSEYILPTKYVEGAAFAYLAHLGLGLAFK